MKTTFYDKRTAQQLERAIKSPAEHHLTAGDFAILRVHAAHIAYLNKARCIGYHKRRKRSRWLTSDGRVFELRGLNPNGANWAAVIRPGIAAKWAKAVAA